MYQFKNSDLEEINESILAGGGGGGGVPIYSNATRPSTPTNGLVIYNSDTRAMQVYDTPSGEWVNFGFKEGNAIVRFVPATNSWEILNDSQHMSLEAISVSSTSTGNGFSLAINNPVGGGNWRKIGLGNVTPDETMVQKGLHFGTSVGLENIVVNIVKQGYSIVIQNTGTMPYTNDLYPDDLTISWDSVNLRMTINHPSSAVSGGTGIAGSGIYGVRVTPTPSCNFSNIRIVTISATNCVIEFYNSSGTKVTPTNGYYFERTVNWLPRNQVFSKGNGLGTTANVWINFRLLK